MGAVLFWSRIRESNPPSRLGKPLYYRYTNPACGGIIADIAGKFNHYLSKVSGSIVCAEKTRCQNSLWEFCKVWILSNRNPANVHLTFGFDGSSPCRQNKNPDTQMGIWIFGTPKGTRTPDLLIRSQSLYPTELSAHVLATWIY